MSAFRWDAPLLKFCFVKDHYQRSYARSTMMTALSWIQRESVTLAEKAQALSLSAMRQIDTLSNQRWHFFRKLLNQHDFASREFAVNRAFYKLWELLSPSRDLISHPGCLSLHLAEAPGSFVQVLKMMNPDGHAVAVSKPPCSYAEVVTKGKAIPVFSPTVKTLQGTEFHYVDLLSPQALTVLLGLARDVAPAGFDLVTADGGFDEEERYDEKEVLHYKLILSEVICILCTQKQGGTCVLKVFDTFTMTTVSILHLLCQHYESFSIRKPATSRPTNSERYVICHGFLGTKWDSKVLQALLIPELRNGMLLNLDVPQSFVSHIAEIADKLARDQAEAILHVLNFMRSKDGATFIDKRNFNQTKARTFTTWKEQHGYLHT